MNNFKKWSRSAAVVVVAALAFAATAVAQDPPGRVARIAFLSGAVSFRAAEDTDWESAVLNYPVMAGDDIWTERTGRAELQLGSLVVRLGANTSLGLLALDDRIAQLRVTQGTINVTVRTLDAGEIVEVDMPNGAASALAAGFYRFDVAPTGDRSTVTVRQGLADVISHGALAVQARKSAVLSGWSSPSAELRPAVASDEWEDWCQWRERRAANPAAVRYVARDTIGFDDLDEFGVWRVTADYGPVWTPHVAAGWTPYGVGHWAWVEPWGWTWVDDAPWGFAPFHYGRWVVLNGAWVWVPGEFLPRPVYAPALVVFMGGPTFVEVGQPVAWFPLGPREVFVPAYRNRVTPAYLRAVNRPHVKEVNVQINVTNITYVNRNAPNAVTVVTREGFIGGRPVRSVLARVPEERLRAARPLATAPPVELRPSRPRGPVARGNPPPPEVASRPVVVRNRPPEPAAPAARPPVREVAPPPARPPMPSRPEARPPAPAPPRQPDRVPAPNPRAAELAARHDDERAQLEARHAAEQEQIQRRQQEEARQAQNDRARQEVQRRQQDEARQTQDRQTQEHRQLEQQQKKENQKKAGEVNNDNGESRGRGNDEPKDNGDSRGRGRGRGR